MEAQQGQRMFRDADILFRKGRYQEALVLLGKLNDAYPDKKNVLYPAALCLEQLGQRGQALALCDQLIARFKDPRAQSMKQRLISVPAPPPLPDTVLKNAAGGDEGAGALNLPGLDALDDAGVRKTPPRPVVRDSNLTRNIIIGTAIAAVALLLAVPMFLGGSGAEKETVSAPSSGAFFGIIALAIAGGFALNWAGMYAVLAVMKKLLHDDFSSNAGDVALYTLINFMLSMIPVIGWIIALVVISKHYELSCGELILYFFLNMAIITGICFVLFSMLGAAVGVAGLAGQ